MKKTNRLRTLLSLILICSLLLVSCSSPNQAGNASSSGEAAKTVKLAFTVPMDDAGGVGSAKFKEVLETESNGKFMVNLFPAGQQGSMKEHWEGCQMGQLDIVYVAGSALETFVPEEAIFDLPALFPNYETAWKVIDGKLSEEINKLMNEKGLELLGVAPYGFMQFHTSKKAIGNIQDLAGLKLRVIPSPLKIFQFEQWKVNPTPIEFAELYSALQSGVVDGGENSLLVMKTQKLHEVQDYITISDHALFVGLLAANKKWYDSLSDEERTQLQAAAKANVTAQREFVVAEREKTIKFFEDNGVTVTQLTDEVKQEFMKQSASTHKKYAAQSENSKKILDIVYEDLKKNGVTIPE